MTHDFARCFFPLAIVMALCGTPKNADASELLVFISAFNKGDEGAIHAYQLQSETGELKLVHRTTGAEQPFFTALSPDRKFLYAIHAPGQFGGKDNEQISAYEITGPAGQLKLLNRQSSMGTASCFLEVDKTGKTLLVANYSSGSVAALPIKADGSLGEAATFVQHKAASVDASRPTVSHAHCFVVSPDNRFAFAADLGLDEILNYRLDPATAKLTPAKQPFVRTAQGAGPRHMTFHPNGKQVYAINELKGSVSLFDFEP
ncbi:MAG: beta-propeller fold lactonase family protein, partial [Planctomycetota bacterium]